MILKLAELEKIELVGPGFSEQYENAQELRLEQSSLATYRLMAVGKFDDQKSVDTKLPRAAIDCLHLDGNRAPLNVGCQQIEHGDVSGEWGSYVTPAPKLCDNKVLPNLPLQLIVATRRPFALTRRHRRHSCAASRTAAYSCGFARAPLHEDGG